MTQPTLTFHGAAGTVSGSRHLLEFGRQRLLIDCGLFQGEKRLRLKNWRDSPVPPATIDAVVLTHAHLDHSGYLPRLVHGGFRGPIYATSPTADLLDLLLYDSAKCQAEDAAYANKKGFSKHRPALPLYDERDVSRTLGQSERIDRLAWFEPVSGVRCRRPGRPFWCTASRLPPRAWPTGSPRCFNGKPVVPPSARGLS